MNATASNCHSSPGFRLTADVTNTIFASAGSAAATVTAASAATPPTVAVTVTVPAARAVKMPSAPMVPMVSSLLVQATSPAGMTLPCWSQAVTMNRWSSPTARVARGGVTFRLVSTGSTGSSAVAVTVTVAVAEIPPAVAVMVAEPAAFAVKSPPASMVPTAPSLHVQVAGTPFMGLSNWS